MVDSQTSKLPQDMLIQSGTDRFRWGRKKVFGLAAFGLVISELYILLIVWFWRLFPLRLIWASALFLCVGGGSGVIQNMLYATLSDVSTDETRYFNCRSDGLTNY